jgi:hypothetical protein
MKLEHDGEKTRELPAKRRRLKVSVGLSADARSLKSFFEISRG